MGLTPSEDNAFCIKEWMVLMVVRAQPCHMKGLHMIMSIMVLNNSNQGELALLSILLLLWGSQGLLNKIKRRRMVQKKFLLNSKSDAS